MATLDGVITTFNLVPAHIDDREAVEGMLAKLTAHTPGVVLNRHLGYDLLVRKALVLGHG